MKDQYRKELKKLSITRVGETISTEVKWKYFEPMNFFKEELVRAMETNTDVQHSPAPASNLDEDSQQPSSSMTQVPASPKESNSFVFRKRRTVDDLRLEYLDIEKKKLKLIETELSRTSNTYSQDSNDQNKSEDYYFLMSVLPQMEKLAPIQKMRVRNKINQAIIDEISEPECIFGEQYNTFKSETNYDE